MIPYIHTPFGEISSFAILVTVGILSLFLTVHIQLRKFPNCQDEELFIFPKILISGMVAFASSSIFDSFFKFLEYGKFKFSGITFYGGLIGAICCMYILLKFSREKTTYSISNWFEIFTIPVVTFHFFGRIGCLLGGCCYGKVTTSKLGVAFPNNAKENIFHYGLKRYPTQLFEAIILLLILMVILFVLKNKFKSYLILYSISRFFLEFLRGDDRGSVLINISPAQTISILIILVIISMTFFKKSKLKLGKIRFSGIF